MNRKIGQILAELGFITEDEIAETLLIQKALPEHRRFGEILMDGHVSESEVTQAHAVQYELAILEEKDFPSDVVIDRISFDFLERHGILPLSMKENVLKVAIGDPTESEGIDTLRSSFGFDIATCITNRTDILKHLRFLRGSRSAVMQRLIEGVVEEDTEIGEVPSEVSHLRDLAQEKGIIQIVNLIIENAVKDRASDIHIEPGELAVRVRYRIDGVLYEKESLPGKTYAAVSSRVKLLSQMNIAERRLPQDGRIKITAADKSIDIRVSTIPTIYGESIVMRLLDRESSFISLEDLGFDKMLLDIYEETIKRPYGMILITGPTGSGKSTTLYASLDKINNAEKKIITIEEPVEYLMKGINQIQVRPKIGLTFASGLRHIVRQDPDIIMVGEIRDMETASISIHAALTGHLLFSTLHTNDAPGAITRLMDMGIENYLVSSTLICVMAQRLVRKICPECRVRQEVSADILKGVKGGLNEIWHGAGCEYCSGTGYRGRLGIFEVLVITDEIREMIMEQATVRQIREKAIALGMRTLREDGIEKVRKGITTIDEVMRVTQVEM